MSTAAHLISKIDVGRFSVIRGQFSNYGTDSSSDMFLCLLIHIFVVTDLLVSGLTRLAGSHGLFVIPLLFTSSLQCGVILGNVILNAGSVGGLVKLKDALMF